MNRQLEAFANSFDELGRHQRRILAQQLVDELHHCRGELVGSTRTSLARQEPWKSIALEGCLSLVECRSRIAVVLDDAGNGRAVDACPAQHLVFDLDRIPRIEELAYREEFVGHLLGPGVQGAALA